MTLEELIDNALLDGKLSKDEIEIIVKKAVNEGYDLDEVKIYLNAKLHDRRKAILKKYGMLILGGISILLLGLGAIIQEWDSISLKFTNKVTAISCGCDNVDDCLSKYKFEEARKFASNMKSGKTEELYKIICSESDYWINQNDLIRAINISKELKNLDVSDWGDNIDETLRDNKYIELTLQIISKYCQNKQWVEAKNVAFMLPEKLSIDEGKGMVSDYIDRYPRKDALKIIEEYKKEK